MKKAIILVVILIICYLDLLSFKKINIFGIRYGFFLISVSKNLNVFKNDKLVFSEKGDLISEYLIIERSDNVILCKSKKEFKLLNKRCYVKADQNVIIEETDKLIGNRNLKSYKKRWFEYIKGIEFKRVADNVFVTLDPISVSIIMDLTYKGLKRYVKSFQTECKTGYSVEMLNTMEIEKYIDLKKGKILLGISEGRVVMVYKTNGKIRSSFITESTIRKFSGNIFLPLILKYKRR